MYHPFSDLDIISAILITFPQYIILKYICISILSYYCSILYYHVLFSFFRFHRYSVRDRHRRMCGEAVSKQRHLQRSHQLLQMYLRGRFCRFPLSDQHRRLCLLAVQERWYLSRLDCEIYMRMSTRLYRCLVRDQYQRLPVESVSQRHLYRWRE